MSAAHDLDRVFLFDPHWENERPKRLSVRAFSPEQSNSATRAESTETAAQIAREALSVSGASRARLAKHWGHGPSRMARKLDIDDRASVTLRDIVESRHHFPKFFHEILRQLRELEAGDGEQPQEAASHVLHAQRLLGLLATLAHLPPTRDTAREMDRAWSELASVARQARRDIRRGSK